ncbi:cGMP-dependent protein kinase 1 [Chanos chanos]|uniref:cGMP-dependent protein kinase n=1 Tax=Chanos chanos TaxID=29144 RepID=A0A6J2UT10_CHACN|nr:cGMP-dependent protein kinase 1-like [Chanos chanos]
MGTLRDLQFALQLKIEELRQRDALIDELELELDAKDDLIRRLQGELDRLRLTLSAPGTSGSTAVSTSLRTKRQAVVCEPTSVDPKHLLETLPDSHSKSLESQRLIETALLESECVRYMGRGQVQALVDSAYSVTLGQGACLVQEGEEGSQAYVIEEGKMKVSRAGQRLQTVEPGRLLGELALFHSYTRSSTLTALVNCKVWVLEQKDFRTIVQRSSLLRTSHTLDLLRSVPAVSSLPQQQLIHLAHSLRECHYNNSDFIIRPGCAVDSLFIVSRGQVRVTERHSVSEEPVGLSTLSRGDCFGETGLRGDDMRMRSVVAVGNVTCLVIDRESVRKLTGGSEDAAKNTSETNQHKTNRSDEDGTLPCVVTLSDLQVLCELGEGQFSHVKLVHVKGDVRRLYALKMVRKCSLLSSGQQERVLTERQILMEAHSPFIVRLYQTFRDSVCVYVLMEACLGGDLWSLLNRRGVFGDEACRFYAAGVSEALVYLHSHNIVHRDVRPENVLLDQRGYPKLTGFGCAKRLDSLESADSVDSLGSVGRCWSFCGTPGYLAPEVILLKGHGVAVDIWALGVFVYELLAGSSPFLSTDLMSTYSAVLKGIDAVDFPKSIGSTAAGIIKTLCRSDPSERLGSQRNGVKDIQRHQWFEGFDWEGLKQNTLTSPVSPSEISEGDYGKSDSFSEEQTNPASVDGADWDKDFCSSPH